MIRLLIIGLVFSSLGCTKKVSSKLAAYQVGSPAVTQVVKTSGTYEIRWVGEDGKHHHEFPVDSVNLQKGDVVGIGLTDDGKLLALAAGREIGPLSLPAEATHCLWYHKSSRETQFGKNLRIAGEVAGEVGLMLATEAILQSLGADGASYEFTKDDTGRIRLEQVERAHERSERHHKRRSDCDQQDRSHRRDR
jgi:hypothetical protein